MFFSLVCLVVFLLSLSCCYDALGTYLSKRGQSTAWYLQVFITFAAVIGIAWLCAILKQVRRWMYGVLQIVVTFFAVWNWCCGLDLKDKVSASPPPKDTAANRRCELKLKDKASTSPPLKDTDANTTQLYAIPRGLWLPITFLLILRTAISGWDDVMEWQKRNL